MVCKTTHRLHIDVDGQQQEVAHLSADQTRILVGAPINLQHNDEQIVQMFEEKIDTHTGRLATSTLRPYDIMFGDQHHWWPSLKYPSPVLTFTSESNIL